MSIDFFSSQWPSQAVGRVARTCVRQQKSAWYSHSTEKLTTALCSWVLNLIKKLLTKTQGDRPRGRWPLVQKLWWGRRDLPPCCSWMSCFCSHLTESPWHSGSPRYAPLVDADCWVPLGNKCQLSADQGVEKRWLLGYRSPKMKA